MLHEKEKQNSTLQGLCVEKRLFLRDWIKGGRVGIAGIVRLFSLFM
jgi:hypothetical protein